ncbi:MAG: S1C family serine protease [Chthoniobacterales bacterium]
MRRPIAFSLWAALACAVQVCSAEMHPAESPKSLAEGNLGEALEALTTRIFESASPSVVRVEAEDQIGKVVGTGFFADADGTIFTVSSVIGDGTGITVTHGGRKMPAKLLAQDERTGVALIKIDDPEPKPFLLQGDSTKLKPSSPLMVVGFPFDHEVTPSFGLVGGIDRKANGKFFATTHIRANVPVQRGQGGSPVLDLNGAVVGILVSGFESGSGGYVLPIRAAEKIHSDFARFGGVRHGWAGVTLQEVAAPVEGSRMAIDVIDPSGPAAPGFRTGDVVLQVGDIIIREPEDALDASFYLTAGDPIQVRIARDGKVMTLPFTPTEHPFDRKPALQALGPGGLMDPISGGNAP